MMLPVELGRVLLRVPYRACKLSDGHASRLSQAGPVCLNVIGDPYGLFSAKDVGVLYIDGFNELVDIVTGEAAREDEEFVDMIEETEEAQINKICENYHNGHIEADEAVDSYGRVNGMADEGENSLNDMRDSEQDMINQTAIDILTTIVPGGWLARGATKLLGGGRAGKAAAAALNCLLCFGGGTAILMADLEPVDIEHVGLGDHVYSQPDQPSPTYGSMDYGYEGGLPTSIARLSRVKSSTIVSSRNRRPSKS